MDITPVKTACLGLLDETASFLDRLVRFESVSGHEGPAMHWLHERFTGLADVCEKVPVPELIVNDPEYSSPRDRRSYRGRPDVCVVLKGDGTGRSVIFNAHVDVVPPTGLQERPFDPVVRDGVMYGRGTCDDKGQIAVLWTLLRAMKQLGIRPRGDVILHLVIEEETGGNGTLALVRRGEKADCCINLEPLSNTVCPSVRGAVWFTGTVHGRAGHSGTAHATVSALKMSIEAIKIIEEYHDELLAQTINEDPLFAGMKNPMPVNFGQLHAGNWSTIAPEEACFSGIFGFLTTPKERIMRELIERIRTRGHPWLKDHVEMTFPYRHDPSRTAPTHPFVRILEKCYRDLGVSSSLSGATTSMDAWLYSGILGIPTLATGCGNLEDAHTVEEHVVLRDIVMEAAVLLRFVQEWCGIAHESPDT